VNVQKSPARSVSPRDGREWYADGLRFECTQCGSCCTGPPGAVWFTPEEGRSMAAKLGLDEATFYQRYARRLDEGWSLTETKTEQGFDCVFLDRQSIPGKAICSMYEVRPIQCRTWPFWPENLRTKRHWETVKRVTPCPGMNSGKLVPIEKIRIQRDGMTD
jgi:Fe-S-cluster containining protein